MRGTWGWPDIDCWIFRHSSSWGTVIAPWRSRIWPMSPRGGAERADSGAGPGGGGMVIGGPPTSSRYRIDNTQNRTPGGGEPDRSGGGAESRGQVGNGEAGAPRRGHGLLHDAPELPDVPGPVVVLQPAARVPVDMI